MSGSKSAVISPTKMSGGKPLGKRIKDNWQLYLMLLVPVVLTIIYKYIPMYGIQIAFRDYKASRGMFGSEWIGLEWFERFFTAPNCGRMIKNTLLLSFYSLLWGFPIPVILALMLNQLRLLPMDVRPTSRGWSGHSTPILTIISITILVPSILAPFTPRRRSGAVSRLNSIRSNGSTVNSVA